MPISDRIYRKFATIQKAAIMANIPQEKDLHVHHAHGGDDMLRVFISAVNQTDFAFDISLVVGGALITGTLVSGRKFWDAFGKVFESRGLDLNEATDLVVNTLYPRLEIESQDEDGCENVTIGYIHLKDVT